MAYTGTTTKTEGKSLPTRRSSIADPERSNATTTFKIISFGSSKNEAGARPTGADRDEWLQKEMKDRKVILRGTPQR